MIKRSLITILSLFILWQLLVWAFHLPPYILPGPVSVITTLFKQLHSIAFQSRYTITETLAGYLLGALFGMINAIILIYFRPARRWFLPILLISQALPTFAIAPLLIIWFGYGMASKIVMTILMIFFPITSNFYDGLRKTPQAYLDLAHTTQASRLQTLWRLRLPAALPDLASGLRIAATYAPMGAIIGEWVGSSHGLGYLMLNANARMEIAMMFAVLLVVILLTLLLYFSVDHLLKKWIWWIKE